MFLIDTNVLSEFTPFSLINRPLCKMPQALISLGFALIL
jgi:hypothetical protein